VTGVDTSREAVEQIVRERIKKADECQKMAELQGVGSIADGWALAAESARDTAAILRALLARAEKAEAERSAVWNEAIEAAANVADVNAQDCHICQDTAAEIQALKKDQANVYDRVERVAEAMWNSRNVSKWSEAENTDLIAIYRSLARAAIAAMPRLRVKSLEWIEAPGHIDGDLIDTLGLYCITDCVLFCGHDERGKQFDTLDEAKTAAQVDLERRFAKVVR